MIKKIYYCQRKERTSVRLECKDEFCRERSSTFFFLYNDPGSTCNKSSKNQDEKFFGEDKYPKRKNDKPHMKNNTKEVSLLPLKRREKFIPQNGFKTTTK